MEMMWVKANSAKMKKVAPVKLTPRMEKLLTEEMVLEILAIFPINC